METDEPRDNTKYPLIASSSLEKVVQKSRPDLTAWYTGGAAAGQNSYSDDSGCLVHTNNSISDIFSFKHDIELLESDGEVSQFDSLDNSEGGMSTDNFNTLKKGPLVAAIDPPPEFQDSPLTTLIRRNQSGSQNYDEFAQLLIKDIVGEAFLSLLQRNPPRSITCSPEASRGEPFNNTLTKRTQISASDPQLNCSSAFGSTPVMPENIYDEPSDSTRNSEDFEVDYYISKQLSASLAQKKSSTLRANSKPVSSLRFRPNSRNSLQSRLSSSHNSLTTSGASKVDDTTFITQAMSHDPLMGRQSIIDFYNVPIGADIYALPVDVVLVGNASDRQINDSSCRIVSNGGNQVTTSNGHISKSSDAKRRLARKAQTTATAASTTTPKTKNAPGSKSDVVVSERTRATVNAKRFSAPDGLEMTKLGGCSGTKAASRSHNKRSKQQQGVSAEKKSAIHRRHQHQKPQMVPSSESSEEEVCVPVIEVDPVSFVQTQLAEGGETIGVAKKESKRKDKPMTVTISKTIKGARNREEKEKKIVTPTSITSQSNLLNTKGKGTVGNGGQKSTKVDTSREATKRGHNQFSTNLKQKFCSIFRFRKSASQLVEYEFNDNYEGMTNKNNTSASTTEPVVGGGSTSACKKPSATTIMLRALPPLPKRAPPKTPVTSEEGNPSSGESNRRRPPAQLPPDSPEPSPIPIETTDSNNNDVVLAGPPEVEHETGIVDFASNLETIKQYGWYWGPISCQAAEKILRNEPDGSFIVRDSSDDHYIFSLTFKLNNCVRHVRIEQDKGTFSFGQLAKFKARTIVEFIEQALEYSRSGRYLFFLHRRPEHGPMRVQLKNPVSRFRHIQSLQHMCRFVIMKTIVRKDLISSLPLPNRLKDYLAYKNCLTEQFIDNEEDVKPVSADDSESLSGDEARPRMATEYRD